MVDSFQIVKEDVENEMFRAEMIDYLRPHEPKALFLLGNAINHCNPSALYAARKAGKIIGICGYYSLFQACSIFSEDRDAARALGQMVLQNHPSVKTLLGMAEIIKPIHDDFIASGRCPTHDPEFLFFELETEGFKPLISQDGVVRRMEEGDVESVARLNRLIHQLPMDSPVTAEERAQVAASPMTMCYEIEGQIVAVASSNGLAFHAFQVLGVATHPSYRCRGYAKSVCSALICTMRERGADTAILFTDKNNTAAIKCYLDLGFRITDRYYVSRFA